MADEDYLTEKELKEIHRNGDVIGLLCLIAIILTVLVGLCKLIN